MEGLHYLLEKAKTSNLVRGSAAIFLNACRSVGANSAFFSLIPKVFHLSSRLFINVGKSYLHGIGVGTLPTKYLGLRIGAYMNYILHWQDFISKYHKRLGIWKIPLLSSGLESLRSNHFWGSGNDLKKISCVTWDNMLALFNKGGLNIGSLKSFNLALILKWKWRWRYLAGVDSLWVNVIKAIHGSSG
ncbi:uncharacterized protein [Rutidosis leptorrhynchoides]|uniref:uncharacterized protein n=1 Tax=Rutidosis leptorrhynchoides TaxID=125765 RepID=UPI003A9A09AC